MRLKTLFSTPPAAETPSRQNSATRALTTKSPTSRRVAFDATAIRRRSAAFQCRSKRYWITISLIVFLIIIALSVGIQQGIKAKADPPDNATNITTPNDRFKPPPLNNTGNNGSWWQPTAGATWQIVLKQPLTKFDANVDVYDVDLFENPLETVKRLHDMGRKVICYFSAGSHEDFRDDADEFDKADHGTELAGWPGENWLNTSSPSVRSIMSKRIHKAHDVGCDGIDPDNIDGYTTNTGFALTIETATDYLNFLIDEAHSLNLAIGLKNAGALVEGMQQRMQWVVNEQCVIYVECQKFRGFINMGKPVFHVEYVQNLGDDLGVNKELREKLCRGVGVEADGGDTRGFSGLLKKEDLGDWVEDC